MSELLPFARRINGWGAAVTAIRRGTKRPDHKWQRWQTEPQDAAQIERLPWRSAAALGIVNGSGGFRVFDIDAVRAEDDRPLAAVPESVVRALLAALGLPDDYQWSYVSGSGAGFGVVVRCLEPLPPGWPDGSGVYRGEPRGFHPFGHLELRWSSGQTVIDGAHPTGPGYRWRLGERPFVAPALVPAERVAAAFLAIAEPPDAPPDAPQPPAAARPPGRGDGGHEGTGDRYAASALADAVRRVAACPPGDRNNTLFRQTASLAELVNDGAPSRAEVERALADAALAAGLSAEETEATIRSAFKSVGGRSRGRRTRGGRRSRPTNPPPVSQSANGSSANGSAPGEDTPPWDGINPTAYRPEDGGILDAWDELCGSNWLYAVGFEEWHRWSGTHWQPDPGGYALRAEIAALMDAMNREAHDRRYEAQTQEQRDWLSSYVNATKRTGARVAGLESLARLRRFVAADRLDAAGLLNLSNGTLDLARMTLRPHDPADLLTGCLPYAYAPGAAAPGWQQVIGRIDPDTAAFLQEFAGYALTPDTQHEIAVWLYGPPGRGASTLLGGLQAMLGGRATVLGLADIERNRFALAGLPGKTLAVATEQPADYMATSHVLNALISGEPVVIDRKYRDAVTITPRVKLAWAMNELPRVKSAGDGIFRRVKVVTFPTIPEQERRPELKEMVKGEAAGILNWALAGLARLRARGRFAVPGAVEADTRAFGQQNDVPAAFVDERCRLGPELSTPSRYLYAAYVQWCEETGHKPQSETRIATEWKRLGFEKEKTAYGNLWRGLALGQPGE